ncbi:gliding motility-associated C-terminal domain-containing protein [bacterium]|nr:gliding motility-associated C-terminal domain-containing protein [bacterium]
MIGRMRAVPNRTPIINIFGILTSLMMLVGLLFVPIANAGSSDAMTLTVTVPDTWAPNAITNLWALTGTQQGTVDLSWTAPADNPGSDPISWYVVKWATFSIVDLGGDTTAWWNSAPGTWGYEPIPPDTPGQTAFKTINGLTGGTTYWFAIKSADDATPRNFSPIDTTSPQATVVAREDTVAPAAVTDLFAETWTGMGEIRLTWTATGDDGWSNPISGGEYRVQLSSNYAVSWSTADAQIKNFSYSVNPGDPQSRIVGQTEGLIPGDTYYFRLWTADDVSNWSGLSNGATAWAQVVTLAPEPPTGLVAKPGNRKVTLTWTPNSEEDMSRYWVFRSTTSGSYNYSVALATVTHPTAKYVDTGLTNEVTYYYVLKAVDEDGYASEPSYEVSARPSLRPREPCGVKGTLVDGGKHIKIDWKAVTRNEDGSPCTDLEEYRIYRSTSLAGFGVDPSTTVAKSILTWTETENIIGKTYYYKLRAVDSKGVESADSMIIMLVDGKLNVIVLSEDMQAKLLIPEELTDILYKETNSYDDDLNITVTKKVEEENKDKVISCYEYRALKGYGNDSLEEIESFSFNKPKASVSLSYETTGEGFVKGTSVRASQAGRNLALFWFNGIEWVKLGARTDADEQVLTIKTKKLGMYKNKESFAATEFTLNKVWPRIFTPNNDGLNDEVYFQYDNPNEKGVVCRIFDVRGALVRQLDIGQTETSFAWDGEDQKGKVVPSGVYIYQLEAEGKVINGTVILAK